MLAEQPNMNKDVFATIIDECLNAEEAVRFRARQQCQALSRHQRLELFGTLSDATLVCCFTQNCAAGEVFEVLVLLRDKREDRLRKYFQQHSLHSDEALDLLQQLYLRLYSSGLRGYRSSGSFESYLFTVARNLMIDHFRKKRVPSLDPRDVPSHAALPEQVAIHNEATEELRHALSQLPEPDATLFREYCEKDVRLQDLAERFGLSVATVWRRIQATKKRLLATLRRQLCL